MEIMGIDVGFGFTKAYNSKNSVIFKSLIGDATEIQFRSALDETSAASRLHISLEGKSYFLGNYAELQSSITEYTLDQDTLLEKFVKIMAVAAAGVCTDSEGPINVVTGLPVGFLKRDSRRLKEMIKGFHEITFHSENGDQTTRQIHIDQVHVIPQPIGSIFNLIFDEFGKITNRPLATSKIGVVDVGFKTTDFSIFDHLQYVERGSSTIDTGISKCFSVIANKLRQESGINIELYRIFKFIESGTIKIKGKEYNITSLKKKVYNHAASTIASHLNRLWENDWDIDTIVLSGGGSIPLAVYLSPLIEGNVIPIQKDIDARFNNVQGYCKFGHYKWGKLISETKAAQTRPLAQPEQNGPDQPASDPDNPDGTPKGLAWLRRQNS